MDPFNIIIRRNGKQLPLNIHPKTDVGYMVLFEGALVGEVFLDEHGKLWGAVSARELSGSDYPAYPCDESVDCEGLLMDSVMVEMIGDQISRTLNLRN